MICFDEFKTWVDETVIEGHSDLPAKHLLSLQTYRQRFENQNEWTERLEFIYDQIEICSRRKSRNTPVKFLRRIVPPILAQAKQPTEFNIQESLKATGASRRDLFSGVASIGATVRRQIRYGYGSGAIPFHMLHGLDSLDFRAGATLLDRTQRWIETGIDGSEQRRRSKPIQANVKDMSHAAVAALRRERAKKEAGRAWAALHWLNEHFIYIAAGWHNMPAFTDRPGATYGWISYAPDKVTSIVSLKLGNKSDAMRVGGTMVFLATGNSFHVSNETKGSTLESRLSRAVGNDDRGLQEYQRDFDLQIRALGVSK